MKRPAYKIAYLCKYNPLDKKTNSGTQWFMIKALREKGNDVFPMYPNDPLSKFITRVLYKYYTLFNEHAFMFYGSKLYSFFLGLYFTIRLFFKKIDLIFISRGSAIIPFLKVNAPIVYTSDATYHLMLDYNDNWANVSDVQRAQAEFIEKNAIHRSKIQIYPSKWAANSAIHHYGANPNSVFIIPSGANFEKIESTAHLVAKKQLTPPCRVLFVGKDWHGKGGGIAIKAVETLIKKGIPSTLTMIGAKPPASDLPSWVEIVPFLDKNSPEDNKQLENYFSLAHFFLLPTRFEAFGLAFAEACAYSLPIMATNTGGVPTCVEEGVNGFLFELNAGGEHYAEKIAMLWNDNNLYSRFCYNSQKKYQEQLNWEAWGNSIQTQLDYLFSPSIVNNA